jgi:DNA-binding NarL/FixJ family response regulator
MTGRVTVLIADDHSIFRSGLVSLLSLRRDFEVVGEAVDGRMAVEMAVRLKPDVVLMDLGMPVLNGLEATSRLARDLPGTKVLILSGHDNEEYIRTVLASGAGGYLLKTASPEDLYRAIETVSAGGSFFSPSVSGSRSARSGGKAAGTRGQVRGSSVLTAREREVLQLVAEGETHQRIADRMFISVRTVDTHVNNIMKKLRVHDTAGLVTYAIKNGIVILPRRNL